MLLQKFSSRSAVLAGACFALVVASPVGAEPAADRLDAIAEKASGLHDHALKMEQELRAKAPDFDAVRSMLTNAASVIQELEGDIHALGFDDPAWAASSPEYQSMKERIGVLAAFATEKAGRLEAPDAQKQRKILAAKAKGLAARAEGLRELASVEGD